MEMVGIIKILLVEDNPADVRLMQEALKEGNISGTLDVAKDGEEALDFLYKRNGHGGANRPDLIILDLNLPRKSGREVLAEVKDNKTLKAIPVVILTTSRAEEDIVSSYELHANCYVTKPSSLREFFRTVKGIEEFWFKIANLPSRERNG